MKELARAAAQVAQGDFSVYIPTIHATDRYDYLDIMILDFNRMVAELGSIETMRTDFLPMSPMKSRPLWRQSRIMPSF